MKKLLAVLLILLFAVPQLNAENTSKTLYDKFKSDLETKYEAKYGRKLNIQLSFDGEVPDYPISFTGNQDAEIWIDGMVQVLQDQPLQTSETNLFLSKEAFFVYGIAFTVLMYHTVSDTIR